VPGRLIFHVIKIGCYARAGKATAMENGLNNGSRFALAIVNAHTDHRLVFYLQVVYKKSEFLGISQEIHFCNF
jgi:hypothetical protein